MAHQDPQVEAGNFTRIHNGILEAIIHTSFTAREQRVILWVLRKTYGFQVKSCRYAEKDIALALGIYPSQVKAVISKLVATNVLTLKGEAIGINKYTTRWTYNLATTQLQVSYNSATSQLQLVANAPEDTCNDAGFEERKERKKEKKEKPPNPQGENEEKSGGDVDLLPDPPKRVDPWRQLLEVVDYFPGELDWLADEFLGGRSPRGLVDVHFLKRPKLEAWLRHPRVARELAHKWALSQDWARNAFGAAASYVENPARFTASTKGQAPAKPTRDYSGWRALLEGQGTWTDDAWLENVAQRAARSGIPVDPLEARSRCKADGLAVAGPWLWGILTQRKATDDDDRNESTPA